MRLVSCIVGSRLKCVSVLHGIAYMLLSNVLSRGRETAKVCKIKMKGNLESFVALSNRFLFTKIGHDLYVCSSNIIERIKRN